MFVLPVKKSVIFSKIEIELKLKKVYNNTLVYIFIDNQIFHFISALFSVILNKNWQFINFRDIIEGKMI